MKKLLLFIAIFNLCSPALSQVDSRILELSEGDSLPSGIVNRKNINNIAKSLIERINQRSKVTEATDLYDFRNETSILIQFNEKYIKSISQHCFKNLHQVNHSGGSTDAKFRSEVEDGLIGIKLEEHYESGDSNIINQLRPKYGYVMLNNINHRDEQSSYLPQYGNVFAVLKDNVKDRSTFTAHDSLNTHLQGDKNQTSVFRKLPQMTVGFYYEAQIWGKTCFSDVDYFLINCPGMASTSERSRKLLMKQGIPVFHCHKDSLKRLVKIEEKLLNI